MPFGKSSKHAEKSAASQNASSSAAAETSSSRSSLAASESAGGSAHADTRHRGSSSSKKPSSSAANDDSASTQDRSGKTSSGGNVIPTAARDSTFFGSDAGKSIIAQASTQNTIYAFGHFCHFLHKYEASLRMKFAALSSQDFDTVLHLDKWLSRTMPDHVRRRGFAKHEEIIEISDWRIQRQIRSNLSLGPMVKLNTPESVERITSNAWHKGGSAANSGSGGAHHDKPQTHAPAATAGGKGPHASTQPASSTPDAYGWVTDAMKELIQLKGVGIPTATAIMMAFWPEQCVPLQEEVFEFFFPKERALFCIATYKKYLERIKNKANELNAERERLLSEQQGRDSNPASARKNSLPHRFSMQEGNYPCNTDLTVQFDVLKVWKAVFSFQLLKFTEDLSGG